MALFRCGINIRRIGTNEILYLQRKSGEHIVINCQDQESTDGAHKEQAGEAASVK